MKIIAITGGTGGIGSAIARLCASSGDRAVLIGRDSARLEEAAAATGAATRTANILNEDECRDAFASIVEEYGQLDGAVNAIGSIALRPAHATTLEQWRSTYELNATSAFLTLKYAAQHMMRQKSGSIVFFSSVAAQTGMQNHEAIAAAKGAVEGLVRSAAISYSRYGIRVNAIAPALTQTEMSKALWSSETAMNASLALHPLGRIGTPEDIASAAHFVLSDAAAWMTGQIIGVDGGLSAGVQPPRVTAR